MRDSETPVEPSGAKAPSRRAADNWEREVLTQLARSALDEQRRARRWGLFFRFLILAYLGVLLALYWPDDVGTSVSTANHTAVVDVRGVIAQETVASADNVVKGLRKAFEDRHTKGVILRINSPGGSPVQAGYIYDEIRRLRKKHPKIPLYAVITDICASGGYYIAAAADRIYADQASIVGSIGVRMDGFGFVDGMHKLGIERRLLTAGEHKGFLDPFLPIREEEVRHVQELLDDIHRQFIARVKDGRGGRLGADEKIFSGLVWSGAESKDLGLVDGLASTSQVAREVVKAEKIVDFTPKRDYLDQLAQRFGMALGDALARGAGLGPARLQ
jgi:protease-4